MVLEYPGIQNGLECNTLVCGKVEAPGGLYYFGFSEDIRGPQRVILWFSVVGTGEYFCFPLRALGGQ